MKLSTRTRYGLRLLTALASAYGGKPVFLKDIAGSQEISEKYLSLIVIPLRAAGLITSVRGAHGGYCLARAPGMIRLLQVIEALEGDICLVDCVQHPSSCSRAAGCPARDFWSSLSAKIKASLNKTTLAELIKKKNSPGAKITKGSLKNGNCGKNKNNAAGKKRGNSGS
ncbi:MAG TPA: Rrf2 family transcriptional regulator [Smithellaceae bacterium]|nr:Rrf2 family transcriptional regulator [Smithellaceae bacterium]